MDPPSEAPRSGSDPSPMAAAAATAVASETNPGTTVAATHMARFEFGQYGTKVLMVEWYPGAAALPTPADDSDLVRLPHDEPASPTASASAAATATATATAPGPSKPASASAPAPTDAADADADLDSDSDSDWHVSWPGKSTFLPARDGDDDGTRRRVYFMLPSDVAVPSTITVSRPGHQTLVLKPLPAIFPESPDEAEAGPRRVLHTMWAKRRLVELAGEVESELRTNAESVGLEMALAEKQWIVDHFLSPPPPSAPLSATPPISPSSPSTSAAPLAFAATARAPFPGRLGDKLKGLRLTTSRVDSTKANTFGGSPLVGDIAVPSFSAIARSSAPPLPLRAGPMSLDAVLDDGLNARRHEPLEEDDLFALPMSPRSPDMIRSPFSTLGARPF